MIIPKAVKRKFSFKVYSCRGSKIVRDDENNPYYISYEVFEHLKQRQTEKTLKIINSSNKLIDLLFVGHLKKKNPWSLGQSI